MRERTREKERKRIEERMKGREKERGREESCKGRVTQCVTKPIFILFL